MVEKATTEKKAGVATAAANVKEEKLPATKSKVALASTPSKQEQKEVAAKATKSTGGNVSKTPKVAKPVKQKMVRDSFTMPEGDYANLAKLKARCLGKGVEVKKSELVRAGLNALSSMTDANLIKVMAEVERLKTGRPKSK